MSDDDPLANVRSRPLLGAAVGVIVGGVVFVMTCVATVVGGEADPLTLLASHWREPFGFALSVFLICTVSTTALPLLRAPRSPRWYAFLVLSCFYVPNLVASGASLRYLPAAFLFSAFAALVLGGFLRRWVIGLVRRPRWHP